MINQYFQVDFKKISAFLAVARCLNFTEAAFQLYTSQSSISKSIASLENDLGYPLFNRERRKISLTQEGKYLYEHLPQKLAEINEFFLDVRKINNGHKAVLTLGSSGYLPKTPRFELICSKFAANYPSYELNFSYMQANELRNALMDNKVDMILFNHHDLRMLHGYKYLPIMSGGTQFTCNSLTNHMDDKPFSLTDYKDKHFISLSPDFVPSYNRYLFDTCHAYDFEPTSVKYVNSFVEIISYISNSNFVSIFDKTIFPVENSDLTTVEIPYKPGMPSALISIIAWDGNNTNPALEEFVKMASNILEAEIQTI